MGNHCEAGALSSLRAEIGLVSRGVGTVVCNCLWPSLAHTTTTVAIVRPDLPSVLNFVRHMKATIRTSKLLPTVLKAWDMFHEPIMHANCKALDDSGNDGEGKGRGKGRGKGTGRGASWRVPNGRPPSHESGMHRESREAYSMYVVREMFLNATKALFPPKSKGRGELVEGFFVFRLHVPPVAGSGDEWS